MMFKIHKNKNYAAEKPLVFLSHKSDDRIYGDLIAKFVREIGISNNQIIYTSHPLHKIPLGSNICDYLRKQINSKIYMLILLSDKYFDSAICMNELGGAWAMKSDYTCFFTPDFNFRNSKFLDSVIDKAKMGVVLNGDKHCRANLIELKNILLALFGNKVDETAADFLVGEFIEQLNAINSKKPTNHPVQTTVIDDNNRVDLDGLSLAERMLLLRFYSSVIEGFSSEPQTISEEEETIRIVIRKLIERNIIEDMSDAERLFTYDGYGVPYSLTKQAVKELNRAKEILMI